MKTYESYKETGIEWIGEIPINWDSTKLKFVGESIIGIIYSPDDVITTGEGILVLRSSNIQDGKLAFEDCVFVNKEVQEKYLTKEGDILLCARNGSAHLVGKAAYIDKQNEGVTYGAFMSIVRSELDKYLFYFFNSQVFKAQTGLFSTSTINQLTSSTLNNMFISFPRDKQEQTAIAHYLDRKTAEIDELIADKKRLLELYEEEKTAIINQAVTKGINPNAPMKDSGIEWLGEIPVHWEVKRIRHVAQIFGRIGYRGYKTTDLVSKGEGAITISPSNMKAYNMEFESCSYLSWEKYEESPEIMIQNNDILFVKTGSTYGKVSFVENLPEKATINPQIIVLKQITCNNKYLWYVLKSTNIIYQVEGTVVGGTIPTISQAKINNYEFPIPSNEEQTEIVTFLDNEVKRVDKMISKTNKLIDLLTEYRTALISEVVTGKIKVTE